jgi:hypothetical protein
MNGQIPKSNRPTVESLPIQASHSYPRLIYHGRDEVNSGYFLLWEAVCRS